MKHFVFLCCICLVYWNASFAQNSEESGKLFVKLHNSHAPQYPRLNSLKPETIDAIQGLPDLVDQFSIQEVQPASRLQDENLQNTYLFTFEDPAASDELIGKLEKLAPIEYAERVPVYEMDLAPNDYNFPTQYHLDVINAQAAWDITTGDSGVVIAVVDNAIQIGHQDLQANIWVNPGEIPGNGIDDEGNGYVDDVNGYDVSDNDNDVNPPSIFMNHGTHVSGCASAVTDNNTGVASIGFNCTIMPVKAKQDGSSGSALDNTFGGVEYAVASGADIVNMSFGGAGFSQTWQNLIDVGHKAGIVFVGSSGNTGQNEIRYPSGYEHVINVGATNSDDRKANYSTYGPTVDVMAPGTNIRSTLPAGNNSYGGQSGTSMATPIVSGLLGLMKSVNPCLTPDDLEIALKQTCDNIDAVNANFVGNIGAGRVNAQAALALVNQQNPPIASFSVADTFSCNGDLNFLFQVDSAQLACVDFYTWIFTNSQGFADTAYVRNPLVQLPVTGTYDVQLVVSNTLGADTLNDQVIVTVGQAPTVNAGNDLILCEGTEFQLLSSTNQPGSVANWFPSTGLSDPNILNPVLTASGGLSYILTVTAPDGCASSDTFSLTTLPNPTILTLPIGGATINAGDSVQLNALGANTYIWTPSTGLSDPGISDPKASPATTTLYTVTGTNSDGCSAEDEVLVTVSGTTSLDHAFSAVATVFSPNPNPADGYVRLSAELVQGGLLQVDILNLNGQVIAPIYHSQVSRGPFSTTWQRPAKLAGGIYLLRWQSQGYQLMQRLYLR